MHFTLYALEGNWGPNPLKVGIFLEQLGLEYEVKFRSMDDDPKKGVKGEDYLKVCPNGRTPALVDHKNNDFVVWESGAILKYLASKYDDSKQYAGKTVEEQATIDEWLLFQCTGFSPIQGNLHYAKHFWPKKYNEDAPKNVINRFRDENYRVLNVFEERLKKQAESLGKDKAWLAFDHPTIADISTIPWFILLTKFGELLEVKLEDYPNIAEYIKRSQALPSVQKIYSQFSY